MGEIDMDTCYLRDPLCKLQSFTRMAREYDNATLMKLTRMAIHRRPLACSNSIESSDTVYF